MSAGGFNRRLILSEIKVRPSLPFKFESLNSKDIGRPTP